ncbi:MAG: energy-coupling factor transporter ATPase [Clostridia bacterium]|nr:energy-coupling factor transporter ATPase [Clostridia bacterium]
MIELTNVHYQYESMASEALCDINLTINDGEVIAVVGHNGSGKSTLSKHLNALLLPSSGTVLVDGMDTKDEKNVLPIRQRVGMVFQNPDNQLVTTVVEEDVAFGPENLGIEPRQIRERVDHALNEAGMAEYSKSAVHHLSGGQKQRVAIAGMLAMSPKVLVLDEATSMLDPKGRAELLNTVRRINREKGITVVMITQYMEEVTDCDRIVVMSGGSIAKVGTPREVFSEVDQLHMLGLDVPEAVAMREELKRFGLELDDSILNTETLAEALCPLL